MKTKHYILNVKEVGYVCSVFGTSHEIDEEFNVFRIYFNDNIVNKFYYKNIDIKVEYVNIEVDFVETYTVTIELDKKMK